jgi:ribosome-binding factor A
MATRRPSRRTHGTARDYPRTARLNELLREIIGEELERIDDERLELLTIISVDVDSDLRRARVYYDCLDGEEGDEDSLAALGEARIRLQAAVGRQTRIKRTPELLFAPDLSVRSGARIDAILRDVGPIAADDATDGPIVDACGDAAGGPTADAGGGTAGESDGASAPSVPGIEDDEQGSGG